MSPRAQLPLATAVTPLALFALSHSPPLLLSLSISLSPFYPFLLSAPYTEPRPPFFSFSRGPKYSRELRDRAGSLERVNSGSGEPPRGRKGDLSVLSRITRRTRFTGIHFRDSAGLRRATNGRSIEGARAAITPSDEIALIFCCERCARPSSTIFFSLTMNIGGNVGFLNYMYTLPLL